MEALIAVAVTVVCLAVSGYCIRRLLKGMGLGDEDPDAWTREAQQCLVDPKDGDA